jgi:hypothetical protein
VSPTVESMQNPLLVPATGSLSTISFIFLSLTTIELITFRSKAFIAPRPAWRQVIAQRVLDARRRRNPKSPDRNIPSTEHLPMPLAYGHLPPGRDSVSGSALRSIALVRKSLCGRLYGYVTLSGHLQSGHRWSPQKSGQRKLTVGNSGRIRRMRQCRRGKAPESELSTIY